ncbi:MAG: 30S ribosomal protein S18 [Clostridia bacterium]|nr:30S ribosomal protein S18 [Clostridia bacterium]
MDKEQKDVQKAFRPRKKKKVCLFCAEKIEHLDYKDVGKYRKCLSERSKILPRRITGTCAKHQRQLTVAVKRARHIAILPYISD